MTATLNDCLRGALQILEAGFIYRKLGLCYDYVSLPGEFPRKTLPTAREGREGKPNPGGQGTGMAGCTQNGGLLFDGYLLRLECGVAQPGEGRIFDRLIGGLIRTATTAPRNYLVRGLTPDGRGFYPATDVDSHLLWAWSAWRGCRTAAIAKESQVKIENIAGKWMLRLERDGFRIPTVTGGESDCGRLDALDWRHGPKLLALLAVAADITGEAKWRQAYARKAAEGEGARLTAELPGEIESATELLYLQVALHLLAALEADEARRAQIRERQREVALKAVPFLDRYQNLKPQILEETPDLDWRRLAGKDGADEESSLSAEGLPLSWRRLAHEADTVRASLEAGLTLVLAGERDLAAPHAPQMTACLRAAPWDKLWLAGTIAPALSLHARGMELGLWDEEALTEALALDAVIPNAALYLAEDYDEENPGKAGHVEPPPRKRKQKREQGAPRDSAPSGDGGGGSGSDSRSGGGRGGGNRGGGGGGSGRSRSGGSGNRGGGGGSSDSSAGGSGGGRRRRRRRRSSGAK